MDALLQQYFPQIQQLMRRSEDSLRITQIDLDWFAGDNTGKGVEKTRNVYSFYLNAEPKTINVAPKRVKFQVKTVNEYSLLSRRVSEGTRHSTVARVSCSAESTPPHKAKW